MVKLDSLIAIGIVGAFLAYGGHSLLPKAISEGKTITSDLKNKANDFAQKRSTQRGSSG